jgi:hypothetical protein
MDLQPNSFFSKILLDNAIENNYMLYVLGHIITYFHESYKKIPNSFADTAKATARV